MCSLSKENIKMSEAFITKTIYLRKMKHKKFISKLIVRFSYCNVF